ncbi:MAG: ATP-binding protein [Candidatus Omnitrophica bacterium]|nr:ATP-binding protein [Candidatus Omnitrophota bacterium]
MEALKQTFVRLIEGMNINTYRYLYDRFELSNRLVGIIGPRGAGKTTLMLQYIKNKIKDLSGVFYVSLDHIYFNKTTVFEFVQEMYQSEGIKIFFLDEVHKYENWRQELKNIYDSFGDIKIVFSGSSSIDLIKGTYDLSRRGVIYHLKGLSFREYLNFQTGKEYSVISFEELIKNHEKISYKLSQVDRIKGHFKKYLKNGYYPFIFEGEEFYFQKLMNIIRKTIYEDISNFYNLRTENLPYFEKILSFLATIPPGRINIHNLAKNLKIDDKTMAHYITALKETGLISTIFVDKKGLALMRKPEKIFIENTTLYNAICYGIGQRVDLGMVREILFVNSIIGGGKNVFYSKKIGDFICDGYNFEIGGKKKKIKQIVPDMKNSFLVKDDILVASKKSIPLYLFGFLY